MNPTSTDAPTSHAVLLQCPIRGQLNVNSLAKDGLTPTEEARRIDFLVFLLDRGYPKANIVVETVVVRGLGESGRNSLRADVVVYDQPVQTLSKKNIEDRLERVVLIAEIKRDSSGQKKALAYQLEPALRVLPRMDVFGAYWDGINQDLFVKKIAKSASGSDYVAVTKDSLANLPAWGQIYKARPVTVDRLLTPEDLVGTLLNIANVMRSHGVNDQQLRYRETVKLLLARYIDEREAKADLRAGGSGVLKLQVHEGFDTGFSRRAEDVYAKSAKRYGRAASLFTPSTGSQLPEPTLRDVVKSVQNVDFSSANNDAMQQVFMSFVPAVFKKDLDQFFTPLSLIETMVGLVEIGPNDSVLDPAMGTADFLTAALDKMRGDGDDLAHQRIQGCDRDPSAYDLAIVNMILNHDGQAGLELRDSIEDYARWSNEMNIVLCNPPFGSRTVETRASVLKQYDLGHVWNQTTSGSWEMTSELLPKQQLGILFIERCWKALTKEGRMGIILPEGYLCTTSYGYVRQWILEHFRLLSLVELPRRIFLKSDADLRSNIVIAQRIDPKPVVRQANYPIHADLVRRVGYKMGKGFSVIAERDPVSGLPVRDEKNTIVVATDFTRVRSGYAGLRAKSKHAVPSDWEGATLNDVRSHPSLDVKPRRLTAGALLNRKRVLSGKHVQLRNVAEVLETTVDILQDAPYKGGFCQLVEGQNIRAVEGVVIPQGDERSWSVAERKSNDLFALRRWDIIIGLVRPERRNVGVLLRDDPRIVAAPDGVAVVRLLPGKEERYPFGWLFSALRSETVRIQLWTESGGTSYGKLTREQIRDVYLPVPDQQAMLEQNSIVGEWSNSLTNALDQWDRVGTEDDRRVIVNSAVFGLDAEVD